jgi:transcriptional antiterminator RfaH
MPDNSNVVNSNAINLEHEVEPPEWFAICTHSKQEDRAYYNLQTGGVECFNPKIRECRRNQFTGAVTHIARPLFPRYIFARFNIESSLRKVSFARGVLKVVSFNAKPAPIDDEIIELLRSRVGSDGFLAVGETLKPGDFVRIKDGPWKALVGVVERNLQSGERVQLLLTAINFQGRLMIEREWVEKVG